MNRDIPRGARRAVINLISRESPPRTTVINMNFPKDEEQFNELMTFWHNPNPRNSSRISVKSVMQEEDPNTVPPTVKIIRQVSIDLNTILFIETFFYNDEPG